MKTTGTLAASICLLLSGALAVWLVLERQARLKLELANKTLRQQLSPMDKLLADNEQLSNLLSQPKVPQSGPNPSGEWPSETNNEQAKELVRLRGEVVALRQQAKELATLRAATSQARPGRGTGPGNSSAGDGSQLEILSAQYWTANTNMDVADALRDRIRDGVLKAIASNNLNGDPEYGQSKQLTLVYRIGGVTMTNQFREGDVIVLPKE